MDKEPKIKTAELESIYKAEKENLLVHLDGYRRHLSRILENDVHLQAQLNDPEISRGIEPVLDQLLSSINGSFDELQNNTDNIVYLEFFCEHLSYILNRIIIYNYNNDTLPNSTTVDTMNEMTDTLENLDNLLMEYIQKLYKYSDKVIKNVSIENILQIEKILVENTEKRIGKLTRKLFKTNDSETISKINEELMKLQNDLFTDFKRKEVNVESIKDNFLLNLNLLFNLSGDNIFNQKIAEEVTKVYENFFKKISSVKNMGLMN